MIKKEKLSENKEEEDRGSEAQRGNTCISHLSVPSRRSKNLSKVLPIIVADLNINIKDEALHI